MIAAIYARTSEGRRSRHRACYCLIELPASVRSGPFRLAFLCKMTHLDEVGDEYVGSKLPPGTGI